MIGLLIVVALFVLIGGGWWGWPLMAGILGTASVMDKPSALESIARLMRSYDITPAEVAAAFLTPAAARADSAQRSKGDIAKTLFTYLGAIFILAGIGTYVGTFWDSMGSAMRIVMTLGVGYILLIVLVSALHEKKYPRLILPLALASAVMMTAGGFVFIHEVFPHGDNWRLAVLFVFGAMALHQGVLLGLYRRTVLSFTSLFFVYGFMNVGLDLLGVPIGYIAIVLGASLFLVGTALEHRPDRILEEPALFIGILWLNAGLFDRVALATSERLGGHGRRRVRDVRGLRSAQGGSACAPGGTGLFLRVDPGL